jgi:2-amino-4-hydroxy-6-hydroxymethyldihydropteridine diphosphokinase
MDHIAYIGLGSNVGDRLGTLRQALEKLEARHDIRVQRLSRFVATSPVGPPQARYLNAAARLATSLEPQALLDRMLEVEAELGRDRTQEVRHGPRTCDLDLLLMDELVIDTPPTLILPHPRMHERLFVLAPLAEIAPLAVHPVLDKTVRQLLDALEHQP